MSNWKEGSNGAQTNSDYVIVIVQATVTRLEDYDLLTIVCDFVRIFVPVILEISLLKLPVR